MYFNQSMLTFRFFIPFVNEPHENLDHIQHSNERRKNQTKSIEKKRNKI